MDESSQWLDTKYVEVLEEELRGLRRRRENSRGCTIADIEGTLKNLYIQEGNNWEGRGPLQDTVIAATIAAHERFIAEWKADISALTDTLQTE